MPNAQTSRSFTVIGEKGATFELIALETGTLKYYDFKDRSFALGHNDIHNTLKITLGASNHTNSIIFPSGGGDYVIKLIATGDTVVRNSGSNIITKNISKQSSDATITFQPGATIAAYESLTATALTETSTGPESATDTINFSWTIENQNDADDFSYGFRMEDDIDIDESYWYFQTTENVGDNPEGDAEDTLEITVASLTNLAVGMELKYHKGTTVPTNKAGSACGTTTISAINTNTSTIRFSTATGRNIAFEDGETMTFRAYGTDVIERTTGLRLVIGGVAESREILTKTVEARDGVTEATDSASTNIALPNTLGISGGNIIGYSGVGVNNTDSNAVTSVTPDPNGNDNNGLIVVQLEQELSAGTVLTFEKVHKKVRFEGSININKYSTADHTINLDLDKIIILGTDS